MAWWEKHKGHRQSTTVREQIGSVRRKEDGKKRAGREVEERCAEKNSEVEEGCAEKNSEIKQKKAIEQRMWWEKWRKVSEERSEHGYRWKAQ
jgi:hypothetical protein